MLFQSQSLFYWIIYSYFPVHRWYSFKNSVSILILLDYLFLFSEEIFSIFFFRIVSILILLDYLFLCTSSWSTKFFSLKSQSLFYWIIYSYQLLFEVVKHIFIMSQSLFYWIIYSYLERSVMQHVVSTKVSILILLDYLFL